MTGYGFSIILQIIKPGSHIPPTYLRRSRRLQLARAGDLFQWVPAHLSWIADLLKFARIRGFHVTQVKNEIAYHSIN